MAIQDAPRVAGIGSHTASTPANPCRLNRETILGALAESIATRITCRIAQLGLDS